MDEVEYSNVTKTESGRGCGLGRGGYQQGGCVCILTGNLRDNEDFSRVIFLGFLHRKKIFNNSHKTTQNMLLDDHIRDISRELPDLRGRTRNSGISSIPGQIS